MVHTDWTTNPWRLDDDGSAAMPQAIASVSMPVLEAPVLVKRGQTFQHKFIVGTGAALGIGFLIGCVIAGIMVPIMFVRWAFS